MQINPICKPILEKINQRLREALDRGDERLHQAASYVLDGEGKRVRPMLTLLTLLDLSSDLDRGYGPAIALELVHNYSLVHDDLPCMDDDDERRGRPTLHKAYDEATAVLCGDYLLTQAFKILTDDPHLDAEIKVRLLERLSYYSGGSQLLLGQSLDLLTPAGSIEELQTIYQMKTSSLFCCALEFAGILAEVSDEELHQLTQIGIKLGLAFQIENDFLKKETEENKFTIFTLLDKKGAKLYQKKLLSELQIEMDQMHESLSHLRAYLGVLFREV